MRIHNARFAGESAESKLEGVREWIRETKVRTPGWKPTSDDVHVATLVASLPNIGTSIVLP